MTNRSAADFVWQSMTQVYGKKWAQDRGEKPSPIWISELSKINPKNLKQAVRSVIRKRMSWPPTLPEFLELCCDVDGDEAFDRFIAKLPPKTHAEKQTNYTVGFACRTQLIAEKSRQLYKRTLAKNVEKYGDQPVIEFESLPSELCIDKMHNAQAVIDAGKIPAGQGWNSAKRMIENLRQSLGIN